MSNKKKNSTRSYSASADQTLHKKSSRVSLFAMFATPEKTAKTFLYSGIAMVLVGTYLGGNEACPKWLAITILVIGVIWNIIAGLIYRSIKNGRH